MLGLGSWPDPGPFRSERASAPSRAFFSRSSHQHREGANRITEGRYTPTKSRNPTLRRLWRLLRTAVRPRPSSPRVRGSIDMAVIRHRGKLIPIGGHCNGLPASIPPACSSSPRSPFISGGIDTADRRMRGSHCGKLGSIRGHRNGCPVFIARNSRAGCTAVRPGFPRVRGGVDMATVADGATHHRGKLLPIIGHRNGIPVFILVCVPHDSPVPRFIQVAPSSRVTRNLSRSRRIYLSNQILVSTLRQYRKRCAASKRNLSHSSFRALI